MASKSLVDAADLAAHFGVTVTTIHRWVRERRVPCVCVTRKTVRFRIPDVENAMARQSEPGKHLLQADPKSRPVGSAAPPAGRIP